MKKNLKLPHWDLSDFYTSHTDTSLQNDRQKILTAAEKFAKKYHGKIDSLSSKELGIALNKYERILESLYIMGSYASLIQSVDCNNDQISAFYQQVSEFSTLISQKLLFFELEITQIPDKHFAQHLSALDLAGYANYLRSVRKFKPHTLEQKQEEIITIMSQTGQDAFVKMYNHLAANIECRVDWNDEQQQLTFGKAVDIIRNNPDRKYRIAVFEALSSELSKNSKLYSMILNNLMLNKKISDELRQYEFIQQATLLSYDIEKPVVDSVVKATTDSYNLVERYYKLKQRVQGHQLSEVDRYSDLYKVAGGELSYTWEESKKLILSTFAQFSPEYGDIAQSFFDNNWIDAPIQKGKINGAYCSYITPSKHPVVLVNFSGKLTDVTTLAHELGHAIHGVLSRKQSLVNFYPSTATAEIASIFCEGLVFDELLKSITDKKQKANLLGHKIQDTYASISRQIAGYLFETDIKEARKKGELSSAQIGEMFQTRLQAMFGKGLTLSSKHADWWIPWQHIFNYNFYIFSYAFGELLSYSLLDSYRSADQSGKEKFAQKYSKALSMGGSISPAEIVAQMGLNISDSSTWVKGFELIEHYISELEDTVLDIAK